MTRQSIEREDVKARSLREQAREAIRRQIIRGGVESGGIYPVAYFASQFGVSATPVREALYDLVHEGLFEIVRNKGFRVLDLSESDLDEILEVRLMLELPAVRQACGKLTPTEISQCERLAKATERAAASGSFMEFFEADRTFHLGLLAPVKNQRLLTIIAQLRDQTRLPGMRSLVDASVFPAFAKVSAAEHHRILQAVARGDADESEALMRNHLEHTRGMWTEQTSSGDHADSAESALSA